MSRSVAAAGEARAARPTAPGRAAAGSRAASFAASSAFAASCRSRPGRPAAGRGWGRRSRSCRASSPGRTRPRSMIVTRQPASAQVVGAGGADRRRRRRRRRARTLMRGFPWRNGSSGSSSSVASAVTYAVPVMRGMTWPPSTPYRALEHAADDALLPPDLARLAACRRRPGRRAWRWCRCRTASGRTPCRDRARSSGCGCAGSAGGPNSSMWSISAAVGPGDAARVQRLADAPGEVGQPLDVRRASSVSPWSPTRKNQLPPQATSPVTGP